MAAKRKALRPVHPNAGIQADYRARLARLVREMAASYEHWLAAQYRRTPPRMAQDAAPIPAKALERELSLLGRRWLSRFDAAAPKLGEWFAKGTARRSSAALQKILRDAGMTVDFRMTPEMRDVLHATTAENVGLIRSIAADYHAQVEGIVMRSVAAGRDLGQMAGELRARLGVTERRAALIARDQNNKATSNFVRVRQVQNGLQAKWLHSHGGKEPRPTHRANSGEAYDPAAGWFDPDPKVRRRIWPGELINCFPASTTVELAQDVKKAYRRWYRGELAEIITEDGKTLCATPNHPILSPSGWRPIGSLNQGDHVVQLRQQGVDGVMGERHEDQRVPLILEVFHALRETGMMRFEVALRDDFHGDGASDGEVDVVDSAWPLGFGWKSGFDKRALDRCLTVPPLAAPEVGFAQHLVERCAAPTTFLMRGQHEALPADRTFTLHSDPTGIAAIPRRAASFDDVGCDRPSILGVLGRQVQDAAPVLVLAPKVSRIIRVRKFSFSGHVFNLETGSGWYAVAGGIIAHNCRCVSVSVVKGFS